MGGTVFSLLTGGAGNANYWHWLFDVLPRLKILKSKMNISEIDFFLFPDLKENFQRETLDFLDIPLKKEFQVLNLDIYKLNIQLLLNIHM